MSKTTNYETDTLNAYKSRQRAVEYKQHHTKDWSWARVATWREQTLLKKELSRFTWSSEDRLLDIPCGTGILGKLLHSFPFQIVASDISREMIELAREEYPSDRLIKCVEADITATGFDREQFTCIIVLGFFHRVPIEIKRAALVEISSLSSHVVILSCSIDNPVQRIKKKILSLIRRKHVPAPCPISLSEMSDEFERAGLEVIRRRKVIPILSAEMIFVLSKRNKTSI